MTGLIALVSVILGLVLWRIQLIAKRRFEVAEEALIAFNAAKDALAYVRNPGGHTGEGKTRKSSQHEEPEIAQLRDTYFVPIERLNTVAEKFSSLRKTQLLCKYHFGDEACNAFDALFRARSDVLLAAQFLAEDAEDALRGREGGEKEANERKSWMRDVYSSGGDKDRIGKELEAAQTNLENICTPYLRYRAVFWPFGSPEQQPNKK